jgi:hypothetical protein
MVITFTAPKPVARIQNPDFNSTKFLILIVLFGFQMGGGGCANPLPTDLLTMPHST